MTAQGRPASLAAMPIPLMYRLAQAFTAACVAALLLTLVPLSVARAQEAAAPPEVSSAEIDKLVQSLEDPDARAKLIAELKTLKAAQDKAEGVGEEPGLGAILLSTLSENIREVSESLTTITTAILNPAAVIGWFNTQFN